MNPIVKLVDTAWYAIRDLVYPVIEPPLRPLTRRVEAWEQHRMQRLDSQLADNLDTLGLHDAARRLRADR